jgi:hypothetical protein
MGGRERAVTSPCEHRHWVRAAGWSERLGKARTRRVDCPNRTCAIPALGTEVVSRQRSLDSYSLRLSHPAASDPPHCCEQTAARRPAGCAEVPVRDVLGLRGLSPQIAPATTCAGGSWPLERGSRRNRLAKMTASGTQPKAVRGAPTRRVGGWDEVSPYAHRWRPLGKCVTYSCSWRGATSGTCQGVPLGRR